MRQENKVSNAILVYAFRYAMPRETGAVVDAIEAIKSNINNFNNWELRNLLEEIKYYNQLYTHKRNPNQCDINNFELFLKEIVDMREFIKVKGE